MDTHEYSVSVQLYKSMFKNANPYLCRVFLVCQNGSCLLQVWVIHIHCQGVTDEGVLFNCTHCLLSIKALTLVILLFSVSGYSSLDTAKEQGAFITDAHNKCSGGICVGKIKNIKNNFKKCNWISFISVNAPYYCLQKSNMTRKANYNHPHVCLFSSNAAKISVCTPFTLYYAE